METKAIARSPQDADKFVLRLPEGMRSLITQRAKGAHRSMNAEIVAMIAAGLASKADLASIPDGLLLDEVIARYGARQVEIIVTADGKGVTAAKVD